MDWWGWHEAICVLILVGCLAWGSGIILTEGWKFLTEEPEQKK